MKGLGIVVSEKGELKSYSVRERERERERWRDRQTDRLSGYFAVKPLHVHVLPRFILMVDYCSPELAPGY